jgi:hypothetical protein
MVVNSVVGLPLLVDVGNIAVLEIHADSISRINPEGGGSMYKFCMS